MQLHCFMNIIFYRLINHLGWKNSFLVLGNIVMLIFFLAILFRPLLSPSNASKEETNDPNQAQRESEETTRDIQNHRRGCLSWGICASNSLKNAIDLSIFKDGLFVMFVISNLLSNTALNVPYIFTVVCLKFRIMQKKIIKDLEISILL